MSEDERSQVEGRPINTGGGTHIEGSVTVGGDFVGRDKITITEEAAYNVSGLPNPYLGLRAFTYLDRHAFGGREHKIGEVLAQLTELGANRSLLFVTGASGSGKSSFVQAGLLPALHEHYERRGQIVRHAVLHPSHDPMARLQDALEQLKAESAGREQINLLIIDQFEECFIQSDPAARDGLFAWLAALAPFERSHSHVIATLRSDYLNELFEQPVLWQIATRDGVELRAMKPDELRGAIQRPLHARQASDERYRGKRFEQALVEQLAKDAAASATYLPLLQVALEHLWDKGRLLLAGYANLTDAIKQRAEHVFAFADFDSADSEQPRSQAEQAAILNLLLDLVEVSPDDDPRRDVRRRRAKAQLEGNDLQRRKLIDDLGRARLLSIATDANIESADIIHESLITNWDRLRAAVAERRRELRRRGRFEQQLSWWLSNNRNEGDLLSGVALAEARELDRAGDIALKAPLAQEYLKRSLAREHAEQQRELARAQALAEEQRQRAEAERRRAEIEQRSTRRARYFIVGLSLLLIAALVASGFAILAQQQAARSAQDALKKAQLAFTAQATAEARRVEAERQGRLAQAGELAAIALNQINIDPERAILLALEANKLDPTFGTEDALRRVILSSHVRLTLRGHASIVNQAHFSPDGARIVSASADQTARVWDAASGKALLTLHGHDADVEDAAFSPDGARIVTASDDRTARIWDANSGRELTILRGHAGEVTHTQFAPDGKFVVTQSADGTVRIWDVQRGAQVAVVGAEDSQLKFGGFAPNGQRVVIFGGQAARVLAFPSGRELLVLGGHQQPVIAARFTLDGKEVVTIGGDAARVWDAESGKQNATLLITQTALPDYGLSAHATRAALSADGLWLVGVPSTNATAEVWNVNSGRQTMLRGHEAWTWRQQFSPDGKSIVTASLDGTARVWDVQTGAELAVMRGHTGWVYSAEFSPDGKRIVTTGNDQTVRVWEAGSGNELAVMQAGAYDHVDPSLLRDWTRLVRFQGKEAQVWDLEKGKQLAALQGHQDNINSAQLSPDGKRIVTAGADHTARVWEADTGRALLILRSHLSSTLTARFSTDGARIVTASDDDTARVWDAASGQQLAVLPGHQLGVTDARFSPDGARIVTVDNGNTVRVWDAKRFTQTLVLKAKEGAATLGQAAFSPDGKRIVTASHAQSVAALVAKLSGAIDTTSRVWDADSGKEVLVLRGHDDQINSAEFSPDGKRIVTASDDKTVRIWDGQSGRMLSVLRGHRSSVIWAQFSNDGKRVITVGNDGTVLTYVVDIADLTQLARNRVTRDLTCQERVEFLREASACASAKPAPTAPSIVTTSP